MASERVTAEAPERIWLPDMDEQGWSPAVADRSTASAGYRHEYVRADLYAAQQAEIERLRGENHLLRTTLGQEPHGEAVAFRYTNWRGETATRTALPARIFWGSTDWHPEPQWLMRALDMDRGEARDFALKDCDFAALAPPPREGGEP